MRCLELIFHPAGTLGQIMKRKLSSTTYWLRMSAWSTSSWALQDLSVLVNHLHMAWDIPYHLTQKQEVYLIPLLLVAHQS